MLDNARMLQTQGVKLRYLTEALSTETPTGRLMFHVFGTITQYCPYLDHERTL